MKLTVSTLKCQNLVVAQSARASKGGKRPYHHGNLREALIETSLKVMPENGVKARTLREIGNRLGVSGLAPYGPFADKAKLLPAYSEIGLRHFA